MSILDLGLLINNVSVGRERRYIRFSNYSIPSKLLLRLRVLISKILPLIMSISDSLFAMSTERSSQRAEL